MQTLKSLIEIIEFQQANDISRLNMRLCDYPTVKRRISDRDHKATLAKVYFMIFDELIFFERMQLELEHSRNFQGCENIHSVF